MAKKWPSRGGGAMADDALTMGLAGELAKPLHLQHLERNLNVEPFLSYVEHIFKNPIRYVFFNIKSSI